MLNIRRDCKKWASKTFSEMLIDIHDLDSNTMIRAQKCFEKLKISGKKVDGYACEGLPKTEEGNLGFGINYTDVFHHLAERGETNPVHYLSLLVDLFLEKGGKNEKLEGFIARGLRTLTSLVREPDFAATLLECLLPYDLNTSVNLNPGQDAKDHTDVLLVFRNKTYRIWLFQHSKRGLPHDIERVTGRRGELPDGLHILCPLKTEYAVNYDRILKKLRTTETAIDKSNKKLESCSEKAKKAREKLTLRIESKKKEFQELSGQLKHIRKMIRSEIDIIEGWYLYSQEYVKRISSLILDEVEPRKYENVVEILLEPERLLSEVITFKK